MFFFVSRREFQWNILHFSNLFLFLFFFKTLKSTAQEIKKVPKETADFPKIDLVHLFPGAMTPVEVGTYRHL